MANFTRLKEAITYDQENKNYFGGTLFFNVYHDDNWNTYLQWCALSGFMLTHFGHLNTTSPCFKPSFIIFSLVAFPRGMAP